SAPRRRDSLGAARDTRVPVQCRPERSPTCWWRCRAIREVPGGPSAPRPHSPNRRLALHRRTSAHRSSAAQGRGEFRRHVLACVSAPQRIADSWREKLGTTSRTASVVRSGLKPAIISSKSGLYGGYGQPCCCTAGFARRKCRTALNVAVTSATKEQVSFTSLRLIGISGSDSARG